MSEFKNELKQDTINKETGLTEKEEYFLSILFDECRGRVNEAIQKSGLGKEFNNYSIRKKLKNEIQEASRHFLSSATSEAAVSLVSVLSDPTAMGAKNLISASKEILDRGGVFKEEATVKTVEHNVFILPAKDKEDDSE